MQQCDNKHQPHYVSKSQIRCTQFIINVQWVKREERNLHQNWLNSVLFLLFSPFFFLIREIFLPIILIFQQKFGVLGKIRVVKNSTCRPPHESCMHWLGILLTTHQFCPTMGRNKQEEETAADCTTALVLHSSFPKTATKNLFSDKR